MRAVPQRANQLTEFPERKADRVESCRAHGAQHAVVRRVSPCTFGIAHAAVVHRQLDAATAGTHVAGREMDLAFAGCCNPERAVFDGDRREPWPALARSDALRHLSYG